MIAIFVFMVFGSNAPPTMLIFKDSSACQAVKAFVAKAHPFYMTTCLEIRDKR